MSGVVEIVVRQADPATMLLVALVWWRLDRRLSRLRDELRRFDPGETPGDRAETR